MLSTEGRCAYAQWRGEEDSCRLEDLNSACDAAISSLSTVSCGSWLEVELNASSQSLFYGEPLRYRLGLYPRTLDLCTSHTEELMVWAVADSTPQNHAGSAEPVLIRGVLFIYRHVMQGRTMT